MAATVTVRRALVVSCAMLVAWILIAGDSGLGLPDLVAIVGTQLLAAITGAILVVWWVGG